MNKPKVSEKWIVDLSPTRGAELGGIRKCYVDKKIDNNLYRIIPYAYGFGFAEEELMIEHVKTVDISRFRQRCI